MPSVYRLNSTSFGTASLTWMSGSNLSQIAPSAMTHRPSTKRLCQSPVNSLCIAAMKVSVRSGLSLNVKWNAVKPSSSMRSMYSRLR